MVLKITKADKGHFLVKGELGDLVKFFDIWQTEAWPEWRTAENNQARKQIGLAIQHACSTGGIALAGDSYYDEAIKKACAEFNLEVP